MQLEPQRPCINQHLIIRAELFNTRLADTKTMLVHEQEREHGDQYDGQDPGANGRRQPAERDVDRDGEEYCSEVLDDYGAGVVDESEEVHACIMRLQWLCLLDGGQYVSL